MQNMKKYYAVLLLVATVIVITLGYALMQSGKAKADETTYKQATAIADKINTYFDTAPGMPANLAEMDIKDAPSTIRFEKVSGLEYKFCVTYKTKSGLVDVSVANVLTGLSAASTAGSFQSSDTATTLIVDSSHKKGENCQNVKPYQLTTYNPYTGLNLDTNSTLQ